MEKLLVVEDEPALRELLAASLRGVGFEVATAEDGEAALHAALRHNPDLMVLDVLLPDIDGFDVVRRLRGGGAAVPVVFLTAIDGVEEKVRGLALGGDDYLTKPFSFVELEARIRAVLRRNAGRPTTGGRLVVADLELDEESHQVRRAGTPAALSPTEFRLLRYLMSNLNRVLSRAQILDQVWSYDFSGNPAIVEQYIAVLRRKVDTSGPRLIHTIRGIGYVIRLPTP